MSTNTPGSPSWLDTAEYPFAPHYLTVNGGRMHYVDEGSGSPVLLIHGTPVWSFLYRNVIRRLAASHRVIAPDHIGFGLSDKPKDWTYTLPDHASNLSYLINELDLNDITLVVHDIGGPIGLPAILDHPERFSRLVITNTFLWRLTDRRFTRPLRLFSGRIGKLLYTRLNMSARFIVPRLFGDRKITKTAHAHYRNALPAGSRLAPWTIAREMLRAGDWLEQQWQRADRLKVLPVLIVWGEKDPAFQVQELDQWTARLPEAKVVRLSDVGHFIAEEAPEKLADELEQFIRTTT